MLLDAFLNSINKQIYTSCKYRLNSNQLSKLQNIPLGEVDHFIAIIQLFSKHEIRNDDYIDIVLDAFPKGLFLWYRAGIKILDDASYLAGPNFIKLINVIDSMMKIQPLWIEGEYVGEGIAKEKLIYEFLVFLNELGVVNKEEDCANKKGAIFTLMDLGEKEPEKILNLYSLFNSGLFKIKHIIPLTQQEKCNFFIQLAAYSISELRMIFDNLKQLIEINFFEVTNDAHQAKNLMKIILGVEYIENIQTLIGFYVKQLSASLGNERNALVWLILYDIKIPNITIFNQFVAGIAQWESLDNESVQKGLKQLKEKLLGENVRHSLLTEENLHRLTM